MENIKGLTILYQQNGGAETYYVFDTDSEKDDEIIEGYQKRRSCIYAMITKDIYDQLEDQVKWFRYGNGENARSGGIKLKVYKPGEKTTFDRELITTDDYKYSDRVVCYSTFFTDGVISDNPIPEKVYRLMSIDMIWCREDTLFQRLSQILKE